MEGAARKDAEPITVFSLLDEDTPDSSAGPSALLACEVLVREAVECIVGETRSKLRHSHSKRISSMRYQVMNIHTIEEKIGKSEVTGQRG